ncbi:MAG: signal peptide peptidase SppA, partial [Lysobacteraceae bacterium]
NMIFLAIVILFLAWLFGAKPVLQNRTTLVIAPEARIVEQYSGDPQSMAVARAFGQENSEVQLRDLLRALDSARTDKRIERVLIRPDQIDADGMAQLREVAAAIRAVRASGKEVIAYADNLDQRGYLLAAEANKVYLHPSGSLLLEGLGRYRQYYREGLQDKLGVDVHLFRVGEYKSAAEPYILDAASPESKQADLFWMNDIWQRYLSDVGRARGIAPAKLSADIDNLADGLKAADGDMAQWALDEHLVDALKTSDQVENELIQNGEVDSRNNSFRQVNLDQYLAHLGSDKPALKQSRIAVVVAQGEITGGEQPPGEVGGESTAALIESARNDETVKALVLRVDSPGGEVFASEQIREQVALTRAAGIPVVVSMGNVAASGGYWISMNANTIYADPSTISGSIGIYGLMMKVPHTLEKIGVHTDGVGTTRWAGAFDPTRPLDPAVGEVIQANITHGYAQFIGNVAKARGQTPQQIDAIARGRVWSGAQAKQRGLVDAFGGLQDAIRAAAKLGGLSATNPPVEYIEKPMTPFQKFFAGMAGNTRAQSMLTGSGLAAWFLPAHTQEQLQHGLAWLVSQQKRPFNALAHCLCGLGD